MSNDVEEIAKQLDSLVPERQGSFFCKAMRPKIKDAIKELTSMSRTMEDIAANTKALGILLGSMNDNCMSWEKNDIHVANMLSEEGLAKPLINILTLCKDAGYFPSDHKKDIPFDHKTSRSVAKAALGLAWNATAEGTFGGVLSEEGFLDVTLAFISEDTFLQHIDDAAIGYLIIATLQVYQNALRLVPDVKVIYQENKVLDILLLMMKKHRLRPSLNTVIYMLLSHLMSDEQLKTVDASGAIIFIINAVQEAMASTQHQFSVPDRVSSTVYYLDELLNPLCALSVNDKNKYVIVENKGLDVLQELLKSDLNDDYIMVAAKTLWNLSFDDRAKEAITQKEGLLDDLRKLCSNTKSEAVRKQCKGALWKLEDRKGDHTHSEPGSAGHIMMSYCHAQQGTVLRVKELLIRDGYKVWMDVDQMSGSTLDAMAKAVEDSCLVLVCASQQYKDSPSCRTEGDYAFQLKKPIVPLMLQRRYRPDGWLGMLMGSKLYINFDGKFDLNKAYDMLKAEISKTLAGQSAASDVITRTTVSDSHAAPVATPASGLDTVDHPRERDTRRKEWRLSPMWLEGRQGDGVAQLVHQSGGSRAVHTWTPAEVNLWLTNSGLERFRTLFTDYSGAKLRSLVDLHAKCPDFLYTQLTKDGHTLDDVVELKMHLDFFETL